MASYTYASYETMSPFDTVYTTTQYRIYESQGQDPSNNTRPLYQCTIVSGYKFEHLEDILSQYVGVSDLSRFYGNHVHNDSKPLHTFYVYKSTDGWETWTGPDDITINYDWDYEEDKATEYYRSLPIETIIDRRQYYLFTVWNSGSTMSTITITKDGSTVWSFDPGAQYYATYNGAFISSQVPESGSTIVISELGAKFSKTYTLKETCYRYCVYYSNRLGGWDWLLVNGKSVKTEDAEVGQMKKQCNLSPASTYNIKRNREDYMKKLTRSWELTKSMLTDRQAHLMHQLAFSNHIYLHDLATQELIPVTYDDKSFEWKTWRNNNGRLSNVTFNLKASRDKYILG